MHVEKEVTRRRRLYLVRHGHVDYFDQLGRPLDPRSVLLSEVGLLQASSLGQVLASIHFDRMLCSDYPRAEQTLSVALDGRSPSYLAVSDLREIRAGRLREIPAETLHETVLGTFRNAARPNATFLGGERWDEFQHRVLHVLHDLLNDSSWDSALIVSHDAVNRVLLGWAAGTGLASIAAYEQDNACLNIVDIDTRGTEILSRVIRTQNFTAYNPGKIGLSETVLENLFNALKPDWLNA